MAPQYDRRRAASINVVNSGDGLVTRVVSWAAGIFASLITVGVGWIALAVTDLRKDVAVLLARPEAVSKSQYERELATLEKRLGRLEEVERERHLNPARK